MRQTGPRTVDSGRFSVYIWSSALHLDYCQLSILPLICFPAHTTQIVKFLPLIMTGRAKVLVLMYVVIDYLNNVFLNRNAHTGCSPFGAAEQRSWWRNKTPNLSERQRVFWRPATGEQHREARRAVTAGCLFLDTSFGQAKEVCPAASKGYLINRQRVMIQVRKPSFTGRKASITTLPLIKEIRHAFH